MGLSEGSDSKARTKMKTGRPGRAIWFALWVVLIALGALVVHLTWFARSMGAMQWDEQFGTGIIDHIIAQHWSLSSLLGYDDTKGPVFFVLYAAAAQMLGSSLGVMRLVSVACMVIGLGLFWPLVDRLRLNRIQMFFVAALFITLPYQFVLGELFMSEPSYLAIATFVAVVGCIGLSSDSVRLRECWAPIIFGIGIAILLHHRVHAVALAGAGCFAAAQRDKWRSWPWFALCALAGLSRMPLYFHWGGFVGPGFQSRYGMGLRLDSLTYLAVAALPWTAMMLVGQFVTGDDDQHTLHVQNDKATSHEISRHQTQATGNSTPGKGVWIGASMAVGALLGLFATPSPSLALDSPRFLGPVMSIMRYAQGGPTVGGMDLYYRLAWIVVCPVGMAGLAGVFLTCIGGRGRSGGNPSAAAAALPESMKDRLQLTVTRMAGWTLLLGWGFYALTRGDVFDRYLVVFVFLWPVVCVMTLKRRLLIGQLAIQVLLFTIQMFGLVHHTLAT